MTRSHRSLPRLPLSVALGSLLAASTLLGLPVMSAFASQGDLDTTFDGDGKVRTKLGVDDFAYSVAIQADGKSLFEPASGSPFALGDTNPRMVVSGDFDEDGDADLATANLQGGSGVSVILNDGSGNFGAPTGYSAGANLLPVAIAVGRLNGDAHLDLAVASPAGVLDPGRGSVLLGNGAGGFTVASGSPFLAGYQVNSVAVGDFDGDGDADLSFTNPFIDLGVEVFLGNGSGGFTEHVDSPFAAGDDPRSVADGDFDEDGNLDLVVANQSSKDVSLLLGDGSGAFGDAAGSPFALGRLADAVAVGDFDEDGNLDVAVSNFNYYSISVLLGDGNGGLAAAADSPFDLLGNDALSVAVGDFDADGHADLATAGTNQDDASVLLGDGAGGFEAAGGSPYPVGDVPGSLTASDLNGDGRADLAIPDTGSDDLTVLLSVPEPAISVSDVSVIEGNAGSTTATFTVSVAFGDGQDVTFSYATADGTATAGSDYVAKAGNGTIPAGQTSTTVSVTVKGDKLLEPDETFLVNLTGASALIADGQGVGTIVTDDTTVSLTKTVAAPGTKVTVKGKGFFASEPVIISLEATRLKTVTADGAGAFTAKVKIPASTPAGHHLVNATGKTSTIAVHTPLTVSTDWPQVRYSAARTGFNPKEAALGTGNVAGLLPVGQGITVQGTATAPVIGGGKVTVGGSTSRTFLLASSTTGIVTDSAVLPPGAYPSSGPVYAAGAFYVPTGATITKVVGSSATQCGGFFPGPIVTVDGSTLWVATSDLPPRLYQVDATTCQVSPTPITLFAPPTTSPVVAAGWVWVGEGSTVEGFQISAPTTMLYKTFPGLVTTPAIDGGVLYVGVDDGSVHALNTSDLSLVWSTPATGTPIVSGPAVAGGRVFVGSGAGIVSSRRTDTGLLDWSSASLAGTISGDPVVANGVVYAGSSTGAVAAWTAFPSVGGVNVQPLWQVTGSGGYAMAPAVTDGRLYVSAWSKLTIFAPPP